MLLYLGRADLSELELPMQGLTATIWLRESSDFTATLQEPAEFLAIQDEWRVFSIAGPGTWSAQYLSLTGSEQEISITVTEDQILKLGRSRRVNRR